LQYLRLNKRQTHKKRFYMAVGKVNLKSLVESFKSVASSKHREDTLPKVILKSHEASNSSLVEANEKPSLWQRVKLNAQKLSQSTTEFAKRHPDALKAAGVATAVAVVAGVLLACNKSVSVGSLVAPKKFQPAEPTVQQSNATVEPKKRMHQRIYDIGMKNVMNYPLHIAVGAVVVLYVASKIFGHRLTAQQRLEINMDYQAHKNWIAHGNGLADYVPPQDRVLNTYTTSEQSYLTSGVDKMDFSSAAPEHFLTKLLITHNREQTPNFKMGQAFHRSMILLKEYKAEKVSNIVILNSAGQASPPQSPLSITASLSPSNSPSGSQSSLSSAGSPPNSPVAQGGMRLFLDQSPGQDSNPPSPVARIETPRSSASSSASNPIEFPRGLQVDVETGIMSFRNSSGVQLSPHSLGLLLGTVKSGRWDR
jgi:ElaB/YqjD/DUF883 family membrane-anchored ribosome-binding protein